MEEDCELTEVFNEADDYSRYLATPENESESLGGDNLYVGVEHRDGRTKAEVVELRNTAVSHRIGTKLMLSEVKELFLSVNVLTGVLSWRSRVFCLLVVLSSALICAISCYMLASQLASQVVVTDGSVCQGALFTRGEISSVTYSACVFIVNTGFCIWFALRGVKLEKTGNLVCFIVASAFQSGRLGYFVFGGTLKDTAFSPAVEWTLIVGVVLLLSSVLMTYAVYRQFGWLTYAKGVTQAQHILQLRQHMHFDTAIKLDTFVSVNGIISALFLLEGTAIRVLGTVTTSITVILLLLFKWMIKRKQTWFLVLTVAVGFTSPAFYVYTVAFLLGNTDTNCFEQDLLNCLQTSSSCSNSSLSISIGFNVSNDSSFIASNASSGAGFIVSNCGSACFEKSQNELRKQISCCCFEFGQCVSEQELRNHDKALMIAVAVAAVISRVASLVLGYIQRREMDIPSVQEMFLRAERNMRELQKAALELRL